MTDSLDHPPIPGPPADSSGKVLVAMSGGVDSSVAAALLARAGWDIVGVFMRLGSPGERFDEPVPDAEACAVGGGHGDETAIGDAGTRSLSLTGRIRQKGCCSVGDAADARLVSARLDVPFYVVNFKRDFGRIIDYFASEYEAGRTPNPCVRCNDWLKFGRLHDYATQIGASHVASGHYARVEPVPTADGGTEPALLRGVDHGKDQSYVLFGARRHDLDRMLLPIGGIAKPRVRDLARALDLPVFAKPDSQEICFVPDDDYAGLLERRAPGSIRPGPIVDRDGRVLGEHPGHQHFTVGQRRGLGIATGEPIFVIERRPETNEIVVGPRDALLRDGCVANDANWLVDPPAPGAWRTCHAVIRAHGDLLPARVRVPEATDDETAGDASAIEVRFDAPHAAVAPGQAVVCYDGERVIVGGWIQRAT